MKILLSLLAVTCWMFAHADADSLLVGGVIMALLAIAWREK
jgi:hypothetical protein